MYAGYTGKILRIDLNRGETFVEEPDSAFVDTWVGGVGFGARFLYEEVPAGVAWSDPENRIIWTTTMALAKRISPITVADNSSLFTLNTSGDYEIAKNLRMTMNGGISRLWHRHLKEEEYVSYNFGTTLTFQF